MLPRDGTYYVTATLLGGEPDRNRRTIYCWPSDTPVCVFNHEMRAWTDQDDLHVRICLNALSQHPAPRDDDRSSGRTHSEDA
jgi:hypothetical protein